MKSMNKDYVINSNINLHYIPMEKLKTTNIDFYIHRELNCEDASKNALLPYVLKSGCKLCDSTDKIAHYLENLYGASFGAGVLKKGEDQIIFFGGETIWDRYAANNEKLSEGLVDLILSVIFEPVLVNGAFKEEFVEREKKNAIDRIKGVINDKRSYAQLRCTQNMCKGEAYEVSKLGTIEGIEKIDAKALYEYYLEIVKNSVIDIYICGDADVNGIIEKLNNIKVSFNSAIRPETKQFKSDGEIKKVVDKIDVTQGKLSLGFATNIEGSSDEFFALMVANSVFGAGAHSKLFNNVREKLSLCYYASSQLERRKGLMLVNAGIEFENFKKAYDEILVQFEAVKKGDISDFEFEASINALVNKYQSAYDDPVLMQQIHLNEIMSKTGYTIEEYIKKIKNVTKEDVSNAMKKVTFDTLYFLAGKGDNNEA